jgi:hypothetical protein
VLVFEDILNSLWLNWGYCWSIVSVSGFMNSEHSIGVISHVDVVFTRSTIISLQAKREMLM